jgi:cation diffusion facilitator CzcD-associated flavoprotein CzcO
VSDTLGSDRGHDVVIIGAGAAGSCAGAQLTRAGIIDFVVLEKADEISLAWPPALRHHLRFGREVISSVFDDDSDTWTLKTLDGETYHGRVVIATCAPMHVPWIPKLVRHNEFRGVSFHSAEWDRDFDPAGKRIAVIGTDARTGESIGPLVASAASVKVFAHPPRRFIREVPNRRSRAKHWLHRRVPGIHRPRTPELVSSQIDGLTESGIRTCDGVNHDVDAIIYGTGFAIPETAPHETLVGAGGLTIRDAWHDGMEPYLGVAVHGFPNYFLHSGTDVEAQTHYIIECLKLMKHSASTSIEVRRSSQQVFNERVYLRRPLPHPVPRAFELSPRAGLHDGTYDGPATLTIADACRQVRVRLTGHVDPVDGRYHWRGTVFDSLSADLLKQTLQVSLAAAARSAAARITEQTPQGTYSIAGIGAPPFAVNDVELAVPQS